MCSNNLYRPVADADAALVGWLNLCVLSEEVIEEFLVEMRRLMRAEPDRTRAELQRLDRDAEKLEQEIDRLTDALASGNGAPEAVLRGLGERERRLAAVRADRQRRARVRGGARSLRDMEAEARERLAHLRATLGRNPEEARRVLRSLFRASLR